MLHSDYATVRATQGSIFISTWTIPGSNLAIVSRVYINVSCELFSHRLRIHINLLWVLSCLLKWSTVQPLPEEGYPGQRAKGRPTIEGHHFAIDFGMIYPMAVIDGYNVTKYRCWKSTITDKYFVYAMLTICKTINNPDTNSWHCFCDYAHCLASTNSFLLAIVTHSIQFFTNHSWHPILLEPYLVWTNSCPSICLSLIGTFCFLFLKDWDGTRLRNPPWCESIQNKRTPGACNPSIGHTQDSARITMYPTQQPIEQMLGRWDDKNYYSTCSLFEARGSISHLPFSVLFLSLKYEGCVAEWSKIWGL